MFQQLTGITAIIFYCQKIFEHSKDFLSPSTATIIYFSVQLVMSAVASVIVDISGRTPLLITSITATGLMLLANSVYLLLQNCQCTSVEISAISFVPMVLLICLVIGFSIGLQTIPLLIVAEIFPTNVKGFALCIVDIAYSIIVTIVSMYFQWSSESFGMHVPFFTFTVSCFVGLIFIVYWVPETKGKTLEDIQIELKGEARVVDEKNFNEAIFY